jgi:putative ABC transport system permease protein
MWLRRLRYLLRNRSEQDDIAAEIQFHRAMIERDLEGRGLTADDARRGAQRALGNDLAARERSHDVWIAPAIQDLAGDVRLAGRLALKEYGFTAAAVVTLALGIAAVTTVFTIVNAMVLRGLPVEHPHRVVSFESGGRPMAVSHQDVEDWRSATAFDGLVVLNTRTMTVADEGRSHDVFFGAHVSAHSFTLLGVRPVLGRSFTRDDDRSGAPAVVILGHRIWAGRYDSDPGIVGRTIRVNETPATVIGVMPIGFRFPATEDMWLPLAAMPGLVTDRREPRSLRVWGRLAADVSIARAQAELDAITERLARDHADTNRNVRPVIVPYTGTANHPIFVALFGAMGFLLLIACANVANLLLARAARRSREISIRASLGASRWRIVRQLLSESGLLAIAAGVGGLLLSIGAVHWFSTIVEGINFPYWYRDRWTMDGRVFTFVAGVCVGTTILFGLLPALHLSRTDVSRGLKDGGRGGTAGPAASRGRTPCWLRRSRSPLCCLSAPA